MDNLKFKVKILLLEKFYVRNMYTLYAIYTVVMFSFLSYSFKQYIHFNLYSTISFFTYCFFYFCSLSIIFRIEMFFLKIFVKIFPKYKDQIDSCYGYFCHILFSIIIYSIGISLLFYFCFIIIYN